MENKALSNNEDTSNSDDDLMTTKVVADIYNQSQDIFNHEFNFIDSDCGCVNEKSKSKCVTISVCLDKDTYDWLGTQEHNRHVVVNSALAAMMFATTESSHSESSSKGVENIFDSTPCDSSSGCC